MNKIIIPLVATLTVPYAFAEEVTDAPDPGDHTKVSTTIGASYGVVGLGENDDALIRLNGQMSGAKSNGNLFLAQLQADATENNDQEQSLELSQVRARYFEVTQTGFETFAVAGASFDYIESSFNDASVTDRLVAIGGVVKVATPLKNWISFPILAGVYAQNDKDIANSGLIDKTAWGMQINILNSIYLHENGTHIQFNPQYSIVDMGGMLGTTNSLQLDTALQMPIDTNRRHWAKLTYTEYFDDIGQSFGVNKDNRELLFSYNYYL